MTEDYTVEKPVDKDLVARRAKWLEKKYPKEWKDKRKRAFARDVKLDYNCVSRWFNLGRSPAPLYLERALKKFPDFPV